MRIQSKEIVIVVFLVLVAILRFLFFLPKSPEYTSAIGKEVTVTGLVSSPPDVRLLNTRLTISLKEQNNHDVNILVIVPRSTEVSYGDILTAKGTLETPQNFLTSAGKEFDYKRYLANQDIYYVINNASVKTLSHSNGNMVKAWLYRLRDKFMANIGRVINPPESDLADGLVLGVRGGFDSDIRNEFITTGTIHIIALSGYNVTVVAEGVMYILAIFMAEAVSIIFGMLMIILFIIMAGASWTAIRAGIMATIALFAKLTGRTYDAGRALVIAALIMIAYDPRMILDLSFQLSFLATGGVLFLSPKVFPLVWFLPMRLKLRELVATTLGAMIAVLPILLYSTGIFSVVALPANILILPLIPLTMLMIFITGILGFISPGLAAPFAYFTHLLLFYILRVIHFFASLPFASITITSFPLILTIILYILIAWWVWRKR